MEGIRCGSPSCRGNTLDFPIRFQGETSRLSYLNVTADESADINILTAEGDKVTLSSDYHAEATLLTYERLAYNNSGFEANKGELLDFSEERNIALQVEGSLSDKELADIEALLNDLGEMLKSSLTGGPAAEDGPEEEGLTLGRYGSLSAFEAEFEVRTSVEVLTAASDRLALETASMPAMLLPSAGARPAAPVQAAPSAAPAPPKPPRPAAAAYPVANNVLTENERAARRMADRVEESGLDPLRFMRLLKKHLRGLLREMRANQTIDGSQSARGESLLEKLFTRIETPSSAAESKEAESVSISLKTQQVSFSSYAYDFKAEVKLQPILQETA